MPGFKAAYKYWFPADNNQSAACTKQTYDPWTLATYNSVIAAAGALGHSNSPPSKETVGSNAANLENHTPYAGAAGQFGFDVKGRLAGADIPVYQDSNGTCSLVPAGA